MSNDIDFGKFIEFAKMRREHPEEYKLLLEDLKSVIKDLVKLTQELGDELR